MKISVSPCPFSIKRLQREVNILLISDLHYDVDKEKTTGVSGIEINSQLVDSIDSVGSDWEPDIVIMAGDLVNTNKAEGYPHLIDLLSKLITKFPNLRHTIFSVPGNHDLDRNKQPEIRDIISTLVGDTFPSCKEDSLPEDKIKIQRTKIGNLLSKVSKLPLGSAELMLFKEYEKTYFAVYLDQMKKMAESPPVPALLSPVELTYAEDGIETVYLKSILGVTLVGHNSSFFCNIGNERDDRNFLFLIKDLVEKINDKIPNDGPVISFMHHPFYLLNDSEHLGPATIGIGSDKNNNFTKILDKSDLILSGHVHGILHDPTFLLNRSHMITNGTSFTTDSYITKYHPYTYGIIKVNKQLRKFALQKRRYKTTAEAGVFKNSFAPDEEVSLKYYNFVDRPNAEVTSMEAEKIRILDYLAGLPEYMGGDKINFLIYQLALYHDSFRSTTIVEYEVTPFLDSETKSNVLYIEAPDKQFVYVYKIENSIDYLQNLTGLLQKEKRSKDILDGGKIFFSVPRVQLISNNKPHVKQIEIIRDLCSNLVLLSKKDYLSINLLYH